MTSPPYRLSTHKLISPFPVSYAKNRQWGDSSEIKTAVPYHHGRQSLLMYIFRDMVVDDTARQYPKMREFAKMGSESALVILRWGEF